MLPIGSDFKLNKDEVYKQITMPVGNFCKETDYFITNHGRVWSNKNGGKWLTIGNSNGYKTTSLSLKNIGLKTKRFSVHRLVAQYFITNPHNLPIVHHMDNDKANPHVDNLMWVTQAENIGYVYFHRILKTSVPRQTLCDLIQEILISKPSNKKLSVRHGIPVPRIKAIKESRLYALMVKKIIDGEYDNHLVDDEHKIIKNDTVLTF